MLNLLQAALDLLKQNYKAALLGAGLVFTAFWGLAQAYGITWSELTRFVIDHKDQRDTLAEQLRRINAKVDNAEAVSHENHTEVLKIVQSLGGSEQSYRRILQMSAENQDIIRALMEFGRIYAALVKSGEHTQETHEHLSALYQAVLEISADNPLDDSSPFNSQAERSAARKERRSLCDSFGNHPICRAKKNLEGVEREINDFPKSVRGDVEIEILRYLSYCSARAEETNQQEIYTDVAARVHDAREDEAGVDNKMYRRKYYWIDYSKLLATVSRGKEDYEAEGWRYYNRLRTKLATERDFLLMKLLQHSNLITQEEKAIFWDSLIARARVN
jgi:hypothetical protein